LVTLRNVTPCGDSASNGLPEGNRELTFPTDR
jgi:hypothetical protein